MKAKIILVLSLVLTSAISWAELYDNGRYTTDSDSGLDWLDVTETIGRSYNQVANGAGGYLDEGWRIATSEELDDLFSRVLQTPEEMRLTSPTYGDTLDLVNCLGATLYWNIPGLPVLYTDDGMPNQRSVSGYYDDQTGGDAGVAEVTAGFSDYSISEYVRWATLDDFSAPGISRMNFGVFLVRETIPPRGRGQLNKQRICGN